MKYYNGDETARPVRTHKHVYFNNDTTLTMDSEQGLKIQPHIVDIFCLDDVEKLKKDNRFLIGKCNLCCCYVIILTCTTAYIMYSYCQSRCCWSDRRCSNQVHFQERRK